MAVKQRIKESEARIMLFLNEANILHRYKNEMSIKLRIDYGYLNRILNGMEQKQWIRRLKSKVYPTKVFFELTKRAPLKEINQLMEE